MIWNISDDDTMNINGDRVLENLKDKVSKRNIYGTAGQVFDPLGILAPFVFLIKLLIRDIWKSGVAWDDHIPPELRLRWDNWKADLQLLSDVKVPRFLGLEGATKQRLVGFCDASKVGYAACVYLVTFNKLRVVSHLITSKTRINPAKITEIPRLELCGSLLLVNMFNFLTKCDAFPQIEKLLYTDSADVKLMQLMC